MQIKEKKRCKQCWLRPDLCYCSLVEELSLATKISVVMHAAERCKTSSTARLLELLIPQCSIHIVGLKEAPFAGLPSSEEDYENLLLFPDPSAPELTEEFCRGLNRKIHLIVPDGTWMQAKKIAHRRRILGKVSTVRIPPSKSEYKLRRSKREDTLCTAEAVAYALGVIEGYRTRDIILSLLGVMTERILSTRRPRGTPLKVR